jgi:hypothetical protein
MGTMGALSLSALVGLLVWGHGASDAQQKVAVPKGERIATLPNGGEVYQIRTPQGEVCYIYHVGGIWCR